MKKLSFISRIKCIFTLLIATFLSLKLENLCRNDDPLSKNFRMVTVCTTSFTFKNIAFRLQNVLWISHNSVINRNLEFRLDL
jgi:hypothetical protein